MTRILKIIKYAIFVLLGLVFAGSLFYVSWFWHTLVDASGQNNAYFHHLANLVQQNNQDNLNILLLGLDQRTASNSLLTDTIVIASVRPREGKVYFLSLPRDLWLDNLKTKINALYYYGQKENPDDGVSLLKEEINKITGLEINYSVIFNLSDVAQVVDYLDGVELEVKEAFQDCSYPVDDGSGRQICVSFSAGRQTLDGNRALQFIRSRKSEDLAEGTDQARIIRQQQLIAAIVAKASRPSFWLNQPASLGKLVKFWEEDLQKNLPNKVILPVLSNFIAQQPELKFLSLPEELLVNPPVVKYGQWVWEPQSGVWQEIKDWVNINL